MYRAYRVHTEGIEKQSVTKQMTKQVSRALLSRLRVLAFEEKQEACRQDTAFNGVHIFWDNGINAFPKIRNLGSRDRTCFIVNLDRGCACRTTPTTLSKVVGFSMHEWQSCVLRQWT